MTNTGTPTLNDLLDEWHKAAAELAALTLKEKALRTQIFATAFPMPVPGTNKVRIDHGMALIGDYRMNYKIDKPLLESTLTGLAPEANERAVIDRVIAYDPRVKDGEFKALTDDEKLIVGPLITVTPGLPGLEIKPQSKVRW